LREEVRSLKREIRERRRVKRERDFRDKAEHSTGTDRRGSGKISPPDTDDDLHTSANTEEAELARSGDKTGTKRGEPLNGEPPSEDHLGTTSTDRGEPLIKRGEPQSDGRLSGDTTADLRGPATDSGEPLIKRGEPQSVGGLHGETTNGGEPLTSGEPPPDGRLNTEAIDGEPL
jgi:hypothetical protein